jgi:Protein of unknown function (DUF2934)
MALKPSNKPRKTASLKQGAAQKKGATQLPSTVTPIAHTASSGEAHKHALPPMDIEIEEQVRIRAYELFERRGRQEGHDRDDWARAEAEVRAKYQRKKSA